MSKTAASHNIDCDGEVLEFTLCEIRTRIGKLKVLIN